MKKLLFWSRGYLLPLCLLVALGLASCNNQDEPVVPIASEDAPPSAAAGMDLTTFSTIKVNGKEVKDINSFQAKIDKAHFIVIDVLGKDNLVLSAYLTEADYEAAQAIDPSLRDDDTEDLGTLNGKANNNQMVSTTNYGNYETFNYPDWSDKLVLHSYLPPSHPNNLQRSASQHHIVLLSRAHDPWAKNHPTVWNEYSYGQPEEDANLHNLKLEEINGWFNNSSNVHKVRNTDGTNKWQIELFTGYRYADKYAKIRLYQNQTINMSKSTWFKNGSTPPYSIRTKTW